MKVQLLRDIDRNNRTWLEAGDYELVRMFDAKRLLVEIQDGQSYYCRILTIIPANAVKFNWEEDDKV